MSVRPHSKSRLRARRRFLARIGAALGSAALPALLSRFAAAAPADEDEDVLGDAVRRARAAGKPLLVLLVPSADDPRAAAGLRRERGRRLARWLLRLEPDAWIDLALCEVACGTEAEVRTIASEPSGVTHDTWFVLVEFAGAAPSARALPSPPDAPGAPEARTSATLRQALRPDAAALTALAARNEAALSAADRERLARGEAAADPALALRAAAAVLARAAAAPSGQRARGEEQIAEAARSAILEFGPEGSFIATEGPCMDVTVRTKHGCRSYSPGPCGMAGVPAPGRKFLFFYVHEPELRKKLR